MSKLSKAIAVLGVVSALGVSALPLSTYAAKAEANAKVQVEVTEALSIAIENLKGSAAWDGSTLNLGRIPANGTAQETMRIVVTNNMGDAYLAIQANEPNMTGATEGNNKMFAAITDETDLTKATDSVWGYKTKLDTDGAVIEVASDQVQSGEDTYTLKGFATPGKWYGVKQDYRTLAKITQQVGNTEENPLKAVEVTFGVHAAADLTPDVYTGNVVFMATTDLDQIGTKNGD